MKLVPTGKRERIVDGEVQEIFVARGGFFDSRPTLTHGTTEPVRLQPTTRQDLIDEEYRLWKMDPIGANVVATTTAFTLGRGVQISFDDENAQFYVRKFYRRNRLEKKMVSASNELTAFGEVFVWLRPQTSDVRVGTKTIWRLGDTRVTFIPPDNITNIECSDNDIGDVHSYIFEWAGSDGAYETLQIPDISKYDPASGGNGCILHFKINDSNADAFGHSELIPIKEWLDNYQEYLRDGVIINKLYRSPCFDIAIEDGTEDEVNAAIARYRGWSIGSNPVHNSREQWQVLEFKGGQTNNEDARRALLLIIAAGVGFAEFMLADGNNANLAAGKSQQLPVIKKFEQRQDMWSNFLMEIFQFVLLTKATLKSDSGLTAERDREGDFVPWEGKAHFSAISQDRDLEVAQTNSLALADGYMGLRTACSRMGLDFEREIEMVGSDAESLKELVKKLEKAGVQVRFGVGGDAPDVGMEGLSGPNPTPGNAGGQRGGEPSPQRNRQRAPGGSDATVRT